MFARLVEVQGGSNHRFPLIMTVISGVKRVKTGFRRGRFSKYRIMFWRDARLACCDGTLQNLAVHVTTKNRSPTTDAAFSCEPAARRSRRFSVRIHRIRRLPVVHRCLRWNDSAGKLQTPSSKLQRNSKPQTSTRCPGWPLDLPSLGLELEIWSSSGAWGLVLWCAPDSTENSEGPCQRPFAFAS